MGIPGLRGMGVGELARRVWDEYMTDDMMTYAAALAFQLLFALFPFLLFVLALLSFLNLPELFDWLLAQGRAFLPPDAYGQVVDVVDEVRGERRTDLLSLGILGAIWIASSGMRSTMTALNRAYDIRESRSTVQRYALSMGYTLAFAALIVLATTLMGLGPQVVSGWAEPLGLGDTVVAVWGWVRLPLALVLAMVAVALVFYVAPNAEQEFRLVTPGSVLAVVLWALGAWGFTWYVANFGRYSVTYGSVGAVIILLFYFYISSLFLLLGAEVDAVLHRHVPEPGDPQPEGPSAGRKSAPRRRPATG